MIDDPLPNQPPVVDHATEEWFDSIQSSAPEPPKSSGKKHLLVGGGILVFLAIAGTAIALIVNQGPACLDANDYKLLSGSEPTELAPPWDHFYTDYVLFETDSNNFDNVTDAGAHGEKLIQNIANFYKTSDNKSIVITISGNYFSSTAQTKTEDHITAVKSDFIKAGVPESAISIEAATYIEPEDTPTIDSETTINVSSATTCK